jgi:hypothetical protein
MENNADKYLAIENARKVLKENGYFVDNLWHVDDVKSKFKCDDDVAQGILDEALTNQATMEQIWFSIGEFGGMEGLESSDYED